MNKEITYTLTNSGYYIPNLIIPKNKPIGKYGMLCRSYLMQHRRPFYNALRFARDMYMRPEVYAQYDEYLRWLLADIIEEVRNGRDYDDAKDAAYTRIYQSINPSYTPREVGQDFCYMDIPAIDNAMFYVARKLLLESRP